MSANRNDTEQHPLPHGSRTKKFRNNRDRNEPLQNINHQNDDTWFFPENTKNIRRPDIPRSMLTDIYPFIELADDIRGWDCPEEITDDRPKNAVHYATPTFKTFMPRWI